MRTIAAQLYWNHIAPNEPQRLPANSPKRIARRAGAWQRGGWGIWSPRHLKHVLGYPPNWRRR